MMIVFQSPTEEETDIRTLRYDKKEKYTKQKTKSPRYFNESKGT